MPTLIYTRHCCLTVLGELVLNMGESRLKNARYKKAARERLF